MDKLVLELTHSVNGKMVAEAQVYDRPSVKLLKALEVWDVMRPHEYRYLHRVFVRKPYRGAGIGNTLMQQICQWATDRNKFLVLRVVPFEAGGLSERQLADWYRSWGFHHTATAFNNVVMVRRPVDTAGGRVRIHV